MHPMMADWMEELEGPDAHKEAKRFLEVHFTLSRGDARTRHQHREYFTSREGFDAVLAKAQELMRK